mgnify:CR=1 FL=1|jgi:hypothetical protein
MFFKGATISVLFSIALLTAACPAPCDMKDEEIKTAYEELAPVVRAIENFRQEQNALPRTLDELAPKYLARVPDTAAGRKFEYIRMSNDRYNIRVDSANGGNYSGSCSYKEIEDLRRDLEK